MTLETLIVGLGSPHGDDQFGWRVAEQLARRQRESNGAVRLARSPADVLGWLDGVRRLMVCDVCQNLGSPGRIHRWQWPDPALSSLRSSGSHDLGISTALALAESLGWLPVDVSLWCAEGRSFSPGQAMSPPVESAVTEMAGRIQRECRGSSETQVHVRPAST